MRGIMRRRICVYMVVARQLLNRVIKVDLKKHKTGWSLQAFSMSCSLTNSYRSFYKF